MATNYQFFCESLHGVSYDDCLAKVKTEFEIMRPRAECPTQCPHSSQWRWTIPGAYSKAVKKSLDQRTAYEVVEAYTDPMIFASKCGLPAAASFETVMDMRFNALTWIDEGLTLDNPRAENIPLDLKDLIFTRAISKNRAEQSLDKSVKLEWGRLMWVEIMAQQHANSVPVFDHLVKVIHMKETLEKNDVITSICVHNMLKMKSLGQRKDTDTLHLIATFETWKCRCCA
jgi:hypothetical protein